MTKHPHVNDRETPGQLPTIDPDMKVRARLGTIISVAGVILGAVIWCTMLYMDIQILKAHDAENTAKIEQIRTDVSRVIWILEPPQSRAVVGQSNKQPQRNP